MPFLESTGKPPNWKKGRLAWANGGQLLGNQVKVSDEMFNNIFFLIFYHYKNAVILR